MTTTPNSQAYGVGDADLPMAFVGVRLPVAWIKAIKTRALIDGSDQSKIIRQAIALYSEAADLPLNGY